MSSNKNVSILGAANAIELAMVFVKIWPDKCVDLLNATAECCADAGAAHAGGHCELHQQYVPESSKLHAHNTKTARHEIAIHFRSKSRTTSDS